MVWPTRPWQCRHRHCRRRARPWAARWPLVGPLCLWPGPPTGPPRCLTICQVFVYLVTWHLTIWSNIWSNSGPLVSRRPLVGPAADGRAAGATAGHSTTSRWTAGRLTICRWTAGRLVTGRLTKGRLTTCRLTTWSAAPRHAESKRRRRPGGPPAKIRATGQTAAAGQIRAADGSRPDGTRPSPSIRAARARVGGPSRFWPSRPGV